MKTAFITALARTIPEYVAGYNAGRSDAIVANPYSSFEYFKRRDWQTGYDDGEADRVEFLAQGE